MEVNDESEVREEDGPRERIWNRGRNTLVSVCVCTTTPSLGCSTVPVVSTGNNITSTEALFGQALDRTDGNSVVLYLQSFVQ